MLLDVKELGRGMELIRRECSLHEHSILRSFLNANEGKLDRLQKDAKTAEVSEEGLYNEGTGRGNSWRFPCTLCMHFSMYLVDTVYTFKLPVSYKKLHVRFTYGNPAS